MNSEINFSDTEIAEALSGEAPARNRILKQLYNSETYRKIAFRNFTASDSVNMDREAFFHDCLLNLVMSVRRGKYDGASSLKAYFSGICRFVFINELKKRRLPVGELLEQHDKIADEPTPEGLFFSKEKKATIDELLNVLDEKCREVIRLWSAGYSMKEIVEKTGYKSVEVARKKKHLCLKGFIKKIKGSTQLLNLLKNLDA